MIKNKSDKTITLTFGDVIRHELPAGWSWEFDPEIEDYFEIKYAGIIERTPKVKNKLLEMVKDYKKSTETKPKVSKRKKK